jgi:hypothetical protein
METTDCQTPNANTQTCDVLCEWIQISFNLNIVEIILNHNHKQSQNQNQTPQIREQINNNCSLVLRASRTRQLIQMITHQQLCYYLKCVFHQWSQLTHTTKSILGQNFRKWKSNTRRHLKQNIIAEHHSQLIIMAHSFNVELYSHTFVFIYVLL